MKRFRKETVICYQCDTAFDIHVPSNEEFDDILCICPDCAEQDEGESVSDDEDDD